MLYVNDMSNFTTDDCSLNLFADDSISYVAAHNISELTTNEVTKTYW